jgi:hypothetical protein
VKETPYFAEMALETARMRSTMAVTSILERERWIGQRVAIFEGLLVPVSGEEAPDLALWLNLRPWQSVK